MITILGQDVQLNSIVFGGVGNGRGGSEHRVGRVVKLNEDKKTIRVNWIYSISSDRVFECNRKSTVSSNHVSVLDKKVIERLDLIHGASVDFKRSNPMPSMSDFSHHDQRLEVLNSDRARWSEELNRHINHVLVENDHRPMP